MTFPASKCTEIEPLLDGYHDGELSATEREIIDKHLGQCAQCQSRLASIARLVGSLKSLPRQSCPRDFADDLDSLLLPPSRGKVIRPSFWVAAGVAAAAIFAFIAYQLMPGGKAPATVAHRDSGPASEPPAHKPSAQDEGSPSQIAETPAGKAGDDKAVATLPPPTETGKPDLTERQDTEAPEKAPSQELASAPPRDVAQQKPDLTAVLTADNMGDDVLFEDDLASGGPVAIATLTEGEQPSITDTLGIATDEDGLYALKM